MNLLFKQKSAFGQVEKFAQVVHSMQALLEQEMNLVQGEIIKITEIVDKDWYRGEANGKSGIFPSSFVRIVDSFPGDAPPDSADLSSYLKKPQRYLHTKTTNFKLNQYVYVNLIHQNYICWYLKIESS